uniref:Uncharacterized protein n=1 Tax=Oryza brachyantha TaxID=4533 RepID=J3NB21_ORYBR
METEVEREVVPRVVEVEAQVEVEVKLTSHMQLKIKTIVLLVHSVLQGEDQIIHGNHRGAMMELREGLCKLHRLRLDNDDATMIPFCCFQEEVAATLNFIYRTQKELAACTKDLCLTMDGSVSSYQPLGNFTKGQQRSCLQLQADGDGISSIVFSATSDSRMKLPKAPHIECHGAKSSSASVHTRGDYDYVNSAHEEEEGESSPKVTGGFDTAMVLFNDMTVCYVAQQNHRGAIMENREGLCELCKLCLDDDDNTMIHFCRFLEEVAGTLNFICRTQKELAACTGDLCLTMDGSESSY